MTPARRSPGAPAMRSASRSEVAAALPRARVAAEVDLHEAVDVAVVDRERVTRASRSTEWTTWA